MSLPLQNYFLNINGFASDYDRFIQNFSHARQSQTFDYQFDIESKAIRIIKQIASVIIVPIGLYQPAHGLVGRKIIPASGFSSAEREEWLRQQISDSQGLWLYKRFTVQVDGMQVDGMVLGTEETLQNGKWVLRSNGNFQCYEQESREFKQILTQMGANGIVFNYPGVGDSDGMFPTRQEMVKAYRAMLAFLEDKVNGIGAQEIIGYGVSIGGGAQADALRVHEFNRELPSVWIKNKTFSDLSSVISSLYNRIFGFVIRVLGWNINIAESSKELEMPEIVIQTIEGKTQVLTMNDNPIINDGMIDVQVSLAQTLLQDEECPKNQKVFIGVSGNHDTPLSNEDITFLSGHVESCLDPQTAIPVPPKRSSTPN